MHRHLPTLLILVLLAGCGGSEAGIGPPEHTLALVPGQPDRTLKQATDECATYGQAATLKETDAQGAIYVCH